VKSGVGGSASAVLWQLAPELCQADTQLLHLQRVSNVDLWGHRDHPNKPRSGRAMRRTRAAVAKLFSCCIAFFNTMIMQGAAALFCSTMRSCGVMS
jgi:hypothetical protein